MASTVFYPASITDSWGNFHNPNRVSTGSLVDSGIAE